VLHHLKQGRLGPVKIIQDQHHQLLAGEGFEQPTHRPGRILDRCHGVLQADELRNPLGNGPCRWIPIQERAQLGRGLGRPVTIDHASGLANRFGYRPEGDALTVG
jgi:hypothetical protein